MLDLPEIVGGELDVGRAQVLFHAVELGGAGDGNDPGFLHQQPGEGDLCGRRLLFRRDVGQQIHQGLIRLPVLRPMQPSPKIETSSPLFPSLRFCIVSPIILFD